MFLVSEDLMYLLYVERAYHGVQSTIELNDIAVEADAPCLHVTELHHIYQFGLVVLDGYVEFLHLDVVLLNPFIHVAFFSNVVG